MQDLQYQIKRSILCANPQGLTYEFELVNTNDGAIIYTAISRSPIAPEAIRAQQAKLNTKAVLG